MAMRALVVYGSRLGATRGIAERVHDVLVREGVDSEVVAADAAPAPEGFDAVVIGGGIYGGHWHEGARAYAQRHHETLAAIPTWLFSDGPLDSNPAHRQEPKDLHDVGRSIGTREVRVFAGAFDRATLAGAKLGFAERFVAERLLPEGDFRDWPEIDQWAVSIASAIGASRPDA
jgi:menaquinone-dependent protoporphyrinogen oxidase